MRKLKTIILLLIIGFAIIRVNTNCSVRVENNIIVDTDLIYSTAINYQGNLETLELDVYQQTITDQISRPVIILVHGGGFGEGDKCYTPDQGNLYPDMAKAFANSGYVAFSVNYRLCPHCPFDDSVIDNPVADILAALEWIKKNSELYHIDTNKILIGGDSAGGGIAVNTSYRTAQDSLFAGCIDLWGGLPPYGPGQPKHHVYKDGPINSNMTPTCIIHGTSDEIVPYSASVELSELLTEAGVYNELHSLEGADHYPKDLASMFIPVMLDFADKITGSHYPDTNNKLQKE